MRWRDVLRQPSDYSAKHLAVLEALGVGLPELWSAGTRAYLVRRCQIELSEWVRKEYEPISRHDIELTQQLLCERAAKAVRPWASRLIEPGFGMLDAKVCTDLMLIKRRRQSPELKALRDRLWFANEGCCYYCGKTPNIERHCEVDHIVSMINGGTDDDVNCVPCCSACNRAKGDLPVVSEVFDVQVKAVSLWMLPDGRFARIGTYPARRDMAYLRERAARWQDADGRRRGSRWP